MPKKILLVDDEPNILIPLEYLLKQAGYEVFTANDGEEGLQSIRARLPDLVLLDVTMPKLTGFEVCETVRAKPEWQHIRIIMLSAEGRAVEKAKGLDLGADEYMTKPFSTRVLLECVKNLIGDA